MQTSSTLAVTWAAPWLLFWLAASGVGVVSTEVQGAEPSSSDAPAPEATEMAPPSAADISRVIQELASVRDYERLYWILDATERQVPPVRAGLLQRLDEHVQQLFQAEVEVRMATALASLQPAASPKPSASHEAKDTAPRTLPTIELTSEEMKSDRAPWVPAQTSQDVQQQIEQTTFAADPQQRMEQMRVLSNAILGVEGREQRTMLRELLNERSTEAMRQHIQAQRASVDNQISSGAAESDQEQEDPAL